MKKKLVQTLEQGDNTYGQVSRPDDLMKAEDFLHERLSATVHDFVNNSRNQEIYGFGYELDDDVSFSLEIKRPGRVYTKDGVSFDLLADTSLELAEADAELPRLDLIVAVLDDGIEAETDLIPFVRLRTAEEFSEEVPPYPPENINAPTELHWRAVPQVKTGTPAAVPSPPTVASNEIPLYLIAVAPGATSIRSADILDMRDVAMTLRLVNELTSKNKIDITALTRRVVRLERLADQPIDLSQIFGEIKTLGGILAELQAAIVASRDMPEIRYDRPKVALTNPNSSKIIASGGAAAGVPYVDIELGGRVNFGDAEVAIVPQKFADQTVLPRYATVAGGAAHVRRTVDLVLEDVTQTAGDGFVDFVERSSIFDVPRGRPASAARDDQFIEIFGGLASDNSSKLGDWLTYDIINDTLTPRDPLSALPSSDRPALLPYGDDTHVLLIAGSESDDTPQVFKINAVTGGVTEIVTTKPTGVQFFGDLIAVGKIFVCAVRKVGGGYETDFWEFNTGTNAFTQLGVTGSVPDPDLDCASGCYYQDDQFVMVTFAPGVSSSGRTFVFDRSSLQWTERMISQPYGFAADKQGPLTRFRMANVNGRPLLVGGLLTKDTDNTVAKVWELVKDIEDDNKRVGWQSWNATFPPVQDSGFCSSIGGGGLPTGRAFLFAGHGKYSEAKTRVYSSTQGGLIATTYGDAPGVSIAETATYVQFEIDAYTADWEVAGYLASITGLFDTSNLKAEVSFNDGDTWHEIDPTAKKTLEVTDSDDPAVRRLRITLYRNLSKPPIVTLLTEVLDQDGGDLEDRSVVRYNSHTSLVKALYIDRKGVITLSETIMPSTPEKALIHKVTPDGVNAPAVKNYINRRRPHVKYTGNEGDTVEFDNELAVPVRYVDARGVSDTGNAIYKLVDPDVPFDEVVEVAGVGTDHDWIVELEG